MTDIDTAVTSRADVSTDQPARYAKQLVSHLGRTLDFTAEHVLGSHLLRFATRVNLTVAWTRTTAQVGDGCLLRGASDTVLAEVRRYSA